MKNRPHLNNDARCGRFYVICEKGLVLEQLGGQSGV